MTDNTSDLRGNSGPSRRTVMKGAAWAAPVIAYASIVPEVAASVPCIGSVNATGGSYPVNVGVAGCVVPRTHWDFQFKITASSTTTCSCKDVRVTFYDNPDRSQLWLNQTTDQQQRYVQKTLAIGQTGTFPEQGDQVKNVSNGVVVGTITAPGTEQDSLHCLINPSGSGAPPSAPTYPNCDDTDGPMATYLVECGDGKGNFTPFPNGTGSGSIDICVPMLTGTMCHPRGTSNNTRRFHLTVANNCGLPNSNFKVTNIQQNNDTNFPNNGNSVWSSPVATAPTVGSGVDIDFTTSSGQDEWWISFTPDGGENIVRVRLTIDPTTVDNC